MSLIRGKDALILIPLYYKEKEVRGFKKIIILEEEKAKTMMEDPDKKKDVQVLNTYWSLLSWAEQKEIVRSSAMTNPDGSKDTDWLRLRDHRIKFCLKKWDLKDDAGNELPLSGNIIDTLPADVVFALSNEYDRITSSSTDDEKN